MKIKNIFLFLGIIVYCLTGFQPDVLAQKKKRKIEIIHSNSLKYNQKENPNIRKFIGDVSFRHNKFIMHCDSAYSYLDKNKIDAFGDVHIEKGDSLELFGDFLSYNGDKNFGKIRRNVKLDDKRAQLYTDSLNFDSQNNYAYYFNGGRIINEDKTISSRLGHYYSDEDLAYFKDNVEILDTNYIVHADTLKYNTKTETAYFFGPTEIYSDENYLYCENGWYKTKTEQFLFRKKALYKKDNRIIKGDTLYFDDPKGYGQIKQNAVIEDTSKNIILKGNYSEYSENPQNAYLTDSAVMINIDEENDSLFLHADTLKSQYDSTGEYRIFRAYYKVKIFKNDLQGMCDSLAYTLKDSVIRMFDNPVLWSDSTQSSADTIHIYTKNNNLDKVNLKQSAFIITQEDSTRFNQIKGRKMIGYLRENKLHRVEVDGNGETIYYTKDGNTIVGINKAISSNLVITLKNNQVARINMLTDPNGTLYPLGSAEDVKLKGFNWRTNNRPVSKDDIFIWKIEGQ